MSSRAAAYAKLRKGRADWAASGGVYTRLFTNRLVSSFLWPERERRVPVTVTVTSPLLSQPEITMPIYGSFLLRPTTTRDHCPMAPPIATRLRFPGLLAAASAAPPQLEKNQCRFPSANVYYQFGEAPTPIAYHKEDFACICFRVGLILTQTPLYFVLPGPTPPSGPDGQRKCSPAVTMHAVRSASRSSHLHFGYRRCPWFSENPLLRHHSPACEQPPPRALAVSAIVFGDITQCLLCSVGL